MRPTIRAISPFGDEEVELTVSDGTKSCIVFAHPFRGSVGDQLHHTLLGIGTMGVMAEPGATPRIEQVRTPFEHEIVGHVVGDPKRSRVRVGAFVIELDAPLPGDAITGMIVRCRALRLDFMG